MRELIEEILRHDIHEAEKKFQSELEQLGLELFGIKPCGCGNRLIEIYIKLHKKGIETMEKKEKKSATIARLKPNIVLTVPQLGVEWTKDTPFTDDQVRDLLKKRPVLANNFEVLPPEVEEKPKRKPKEQKPDAEKKEVEKESEPKEEKE